MKKRQRLIKKKGKELDLLKEKVEYRHLSSEREETPQMNHSQTLPVLAAPKPNNPENRIKMPENRILARIGLNRSNTNILNEYIKVKPVEVAQSPSSPVKSMISIKSIKSPSISPSPKKQKQT